MTAPVDWTDAATDCLSGEYDPYTIYHVPATTIII